MNLKNIVAVAVTVGASLVLAGCSSGPDDSLAMAKIKDKFKNDAEYIVPRDIKRVNGWKQGDSEYIVEYNYNLAAVCNYMDCIFKALPKFKKPPADSGLLFAILLTTGSDNAFGAMMRDGIKTDESGKVVVDAADRIKGGRIDKQLLDYIGDYHADGAFSRQEVVLAAMWEVEGLGIKPESKIGEIVRTQNWKAHFRNTEKGWQLTE